MKTLRLLSLVAGAAIFCIAPRESLAADGGLPADAGRDAALAHDAAVRDAGVVVAPDGASPRDGALAPPRHVVGQACKTKADCADGLICLTEGSDALGLGGPAGGLCTVDCMTNSQADCDRVDTGSVCASNNAHTFAFCYELCTTGTPSDAEPKCHDRTNMGCYPSPTGTAFCTPLCSTTTDCAGRACDPRAGLCVDSFNQPFIIGVACDPGPPPSGCPGPCSTLGTGVGSTSNSFCSKTCIIGEPETCATDANASGSLTSVCALRFQDGEGPGDVGECMQLCDCDDDCKNPAFICTPRNAEGTGHTGTCYPKLTFTGITPGSPCHPPTPAPDAASPVTGAEPEAGVPDAGSDGGLALSATGGCDCRVTPRGPRRSAALFALLSTVLLLGRRRRRARSS